MKLLGAVLILGGAGLLCREKLSRRRAEREALRALAAALEELEREVRASLTPLPRLLERCAAGGRAESFFAAILSQRQREPDAPLPDHWRAAAHSLPLSLREQESLARPAAALGGEEEDLLRALRAASTELRASLAERERSAAGEERLIAAISLSLSLLFAILLV